MKTLTEAVVCVEQVWDLRQNKLIYNMHGHGDSVTGLALSSEGSYLLSNSMDSTGRTEDTAFSFPQAATC